MRNTTEITILGNLTEDPEIKFTSTGIPVARFTVASTPRFYKDGSWQDGEPTFWDCTAWRNLAENVAETCERGTRVVLVGRINTQRWENEDGERRSRLVLDVDDVGPSLMFASARLQRVRRSTGKRADKPARDKSNDQTPSGPAREDAPWSDDPWANGDQAGDQADTAPAES